MHHPFNLPETLPGTHAPARIWAPLIDVDHAAQRQIRAVADLPWTHGVAIMPDVHVGTAVTIGSVIAMRDAVSPAAVGGDIGCGMMAVRTNLTTSDLPESLAPLRAAWEAAVPVGPNHHATRAPILKTHGLIRQRLTRHFRRFTDLSVDVSASEQTANAAPWAAATTSSNSAPTPPKPFGSHSTPAPETSAKKSPTATLGGQKPWTGTAAAPTITSPSSSAGTLLGWNKPNGRTTSTISPGPKTMPPSTEPS